MSLRPRLTARASVWLATVPLSPGSTRRRYRDEILAELHGLGTLRRASLLVGLLLHAGALAAAVNGGIQAVAVRRRRSVGCWTTVHHHWHLEFTDDNQRYLRCRRCGADRDGAGRSVPGGLVIASLTNLH